MKTGNKIRLIALLCAICIVAMNAQNSTNISAVKKNELITLAKEVVLKFGPDYYREYKSPVIEESKYGGEKFTVGRAFFSISFPYDPTQETLDWEHYAASVDIWADTFEPFSVGFGCAMGRLIPEGMDWRNDTSEVQAYYDATRPIYPDHTEIVYPDSLKGNPDKIDEYVNRMVRIPKNKNELLQKGWVEIDNDQWIRAAPALPPHKRVAKF